eukprot:m.428832 g.428832  ORF g.428832 m.428832 type:complete len:208 (+) comp16888_c0_seq1:16-639(+)
MVANYFSAPRGADEHSRATMREIHVTQFVNINPKCQVTVDRRTITVSGPRGELKRAFKASKFEAEKTADGKKIKLDFWWTNRKESAVVRTICSHINNMMTGVTKGYRYKMKSVYAHFPINTAITEGGKKIEIRNFLGEKIVRTVRVHDGVTVKAGEKDEIVLEGNDIEKVSVSAALIQQSTTCKKKDIRKFLDGIYVSEKTKIDLEA